MKIVMDKIRGDTIIDEDTQLNGMIVGKTTVSECTQLELNGMVVGNLVLKKASTVYLYGMVVGDVINEGGRLEVFGTVNGIVVRKNGETLIDTRAIIRYGQH